MCLQPFRSPCWSSPGTPGRPWVPSVGNQWPVTGILNFSFCFVFTAFPFGVTSIMANNTAFLFVKYQGGCLKRVSLKEVRQFSSWLREVVQKQAWKCESNPQKTTGTGYVGKLELANLRISKNPAMNHLRNEIVGWPTTLFSVFQCGECSCVSQNFWSQTPAPMFLDVTEYHKLQKQIVIIAARYWILFTIYKSFPYTVAFGWSNALKYEF